jgi:hypothetical protein
MRPRVPCRICGQTYHSASARNRHEARAHANNIAYQCGICSQMFDSFNQLNTHRFSHAPQNSFQEHERSWNTCVTFRKYFSEVSSLQEAFQQTTQELHDIICFYVEQQRNLKVSIVYVAEYVKNDSNGQVVERQNFSLREEAREMYNHFMVSDFIEEVCSLLSTRSEDILENGSSWIFNEAKFCDIEIGICRPLNGSCGEAITINSLNQMKRLKSLSTKAGEEKDCFFLALAAAMVNKEERQNKKHLRQFVKENLVVNVPLPVKLRDIPKIEHENRHLGLAVNVLHAEDNPSEDLACPYSVTPIYRTSIKREFVLRM